MTSSIEATDQAAEAVGTAPRVSLKDIERAIAFKHYTTGGRIVAMLHGGQVPPDAKSLEVLSICLLVMRNGFTVIGKSAPAHPDNYDYELGHRFAYEDAIRQLWPLMGFALRDRIHRDHMDTETFEHAMDTTE